jgi:DNA invertase Pin-like site-specific DNA recombinase
MKKAIGYIRISTKDQSNFSLEGQEKYIREYAERLQITVSAIFKDDGKSAKNFDRPDWKKLETFIHDHYRDVDYLVVAKYDRFSRNAAQGLQKIELLERKYHIVIISVFEQMFIDYDSPFFFKQRADMLVNAEFELHVIRDRTKFGIHQALSSGRFINHSPFGYKNSRDEKNKPVIVIDQEKAPVIKKIFTMYVSGCDLMEIYRGAKRSGLSATGNSAIPRILGNCVYAGLIYVPAYRKEAAKYVKSMHEAIIDEHTWWEVQERIGNVKSNRNIANEQVPLKGVLKCQCGKGFTAGNSRGKSGKYYWYYLCHSHRETNHPAKRLHDQFDEILKTLSLREPQIAGLQEIAEAEMHEQLKDRYSRVTSLKKELLTTDEKIENLEEKFIEGYLAPVTYKKWYSKFSAAQSSLRHQLAAEENYTDHWKLFHEQIHRLTDIHYLFHEAELLQKRVFIRQVFGVGFHYFEGAYRTPYLLPLLNHNTLILKQKKLLYVEQPKQLVAEIERSTPTGSTVELHSSFLQLVAEIKTA